MNRQSKTSLDHFRQKHRKINKFRRFDEKRQEWNIQGKFCTILKNISGCLEVAIGKCGNRDFVI